MSTALLAFFFYFFIESLREELLLRSSLRSLASFSRIARSLAYSAASSRFLSARFFLRAKRARFLCSTTGVTRRWILGALDLAFLPSFSGNGLLTTYCLTSSSFVRLKRRRILDALLGPRRRGTVVSVKPSISPSPFLTITIAKTPM